MNTPTPTGSGKLIWRIELTRVTVDCAQFAKAEAAPLVAYPERDMRITQEKLPA